jgi:hypothetical protein
MGLIDFSTNQVEEEVINNPYEKVRRRRIIENNKYLEAILQNACQ